MKVDRLHIVIILISYSSAVFFGYWIISLILTAILFVAIYHSLKYNVKKNTYGRLIYLFLNLVLFYQLNFNIIGWKKVENWYLWCLSFLLLIFLFFLFLLGKDVFKANE